MPEGGDFVKAEICHESGCLKGMNCPDTEIDTVWVVKKGREASVCVYHKRVHLSEDMKYQVYEDCAGNRGDYPHILVHIASLVGMVL